jgi:hypothetical protein
MRALRSQDSECQRLQAEANATELLAVRQHDGAATRYVGFDPAMHYRQETGIARRPPSVIILPSGLGPAETVSSGYRVSDHPITGLESQ